MTRQTDLNDPAALERQERQQRMTAEQTEADMLWLLRDRRGRRLFARLLDMAGVLKSSMTGNSHTFYNEGRRSIGLDLWAEMERLYPEAYPLMVQERREDIERA